LRLTAAILEGEAAPLSVRRRPFAKPEPRSGVQGRRYPAKRSRPHLGSFRRTPGSTPARQISDFHTTIISICSH